MTQKVTEKLLREMEKWSLLLTIKYLGKILQNWTLLYFLFFERKSLNLRYKLDKARTLTFIVKQQDHVAWQMIKQLILSTY